MSDASVETRPAWRRIHRSDLAVKFQRSPRAVISGAALLMLALAAIGAPLLATTNPYDLSTLFLWDSRLPPVWMEGGDARYLLGTDSQGADLLSLILYGMRASLMVGVAAVCLSVSIGTTLGLIAGYLGGRVDSLIMRIADIQFTFPAILLALLIGGIAKAVAPDLVAGRGMIAVVILALGVSHWPHFARLVRGATMIEREKDYVAAAQLAGRGRFRIMATQILPNTLNPIFVLATLDIAFAILGEATLSFLGFGLPTTEPSLGTLIRSGYDYLFAGEWWLVIFPSLALVLLVLAVNLFGDWLRDALNPRLD